MLQALREKAQGWIAWVVVILIALTFVLFWGSGSFFSSEQVSEKAIAVVNGEKITVQDLDSQYETVIRQQDPSLAKLDPATVKKQLLDNLIEEKILIQSAVKMGFVVNPHRVDMFITSSPIFLKDGQFSKEAYRRFLYGMGVSDKAFREMLTARLLQQQLYAALANTSFVVTPDVNTFLKFYTQKRSFKYITVDKKPFADAVEISEADVKDYYDQHTDKFYTPEKIAIEYITLNVEGLKAKHQPTEEQLRAFYKDNIHLFSDAERRLPAHILIELPKEADESTIALAQSKVAELESKLKAGESFDDLAKQYSEDEETKDNGGKLDWIVKGEIGLPEFEEAAFSLNKGEVSQPIQTQFGYHFIKMLDIEAEQKHSFEEVREQVLQAAQERWAEDEMINLSDQMANLAYDHPDSLLPIADKLELTILQSPMFDRSAETQDKVISHPLVLDAAFSDYVKIDGNNSDLIKLDDNAYIVLRVTERLPSALKPLDEVRAEIKTNLVHERSNQLAKTAAERVMKDVIENASKSEDQQSSIVNWIQKAKVGRTEASVNNVLLKHVFELPRIQEDKPVVDIVQLEDGDYAVVWLTEVIDGDHSDLSEYEKTQLEEQLVRQFGELEFVLFARERFNQATIKNETKDSVL